MAKEMTANDDMERFRTGAAKYAAYLATPEGRLRVDLAFANLQEFLPQARHSLRALDLGCGTGAIAVRLARLGFHVTLLDSSFPMLDEAKRAAQEAAVTERIAVQHGDVSQVEKLFGVGDFDLVLCHNVLEFVDDPWTVLRSAARALRESSGIISVLARNQQGEVLKAALVNGDLAATEHNLSAEWANESLYGGKVRLFTAEGLRTMVTAASLAVIAERGFVPSRITCRPGFLEKMSTSAFSNWSASWARARGLPQSRVTRSAWRVAQGRLRVIHEQHHSQDFVVCISRDCARWRHFARARAHQRMQPRLFFLLSRSDAQGSPFPGSSEVRY